MGILDEFDPILKRALSPGERLVDIKVAAQIIIDERLEFSGRSRATIEDAEIALLSFCFPLPGGPPKDPDYEEEVKEFRREILPGISDDKEQQGDLKKRLQPELLRIRRSKFYYPSFAMFFRFREGEQFLRP